MNTKLVTTTVALLTLLSFVSVTNVSASVPPPPPYGPGLGYPPLPDDDGYPSRAVSGDPCPANNDVGYSGATGTYHVYTGSGFLANALDSCMQTPNVGEIVTCFSTALGTFVGDPTNPDPLVDAVFDCNAEGILNTGTDGEFEWGFASAWLQVRTGPTSAGNGGGTHGCINTAFDGHHGTDTVIHVLDATVGASVAFDVTADWSRNAAPGDGDCGDGTVEPCQFSGPPPATPPTPDPGDLPGTIGGTLDWIFHNLEAASGCNSLDYASFVDAGESPCTGAAGFTSDVANCWDATAHGFANLAEVGSTAGYDGSAGGTLVVFISPQVGTTTSVPVAGWVWTDTTNTPSGEYYCPSDEGTVAEVHVGAVGVTVSGEAALDANHGISVAAGSAARECHVIYIDPAYVTCAWNPDPMGGGRNYKCQLAKVNGQTVPGVWLAAGKICTEITWYDRGVDGNPWEGLPDDRIVTSTCV